MALAPATHPLAGHTELHASELSGAGLRIIRTADSGQAIAARVAAGTAIGVAVDSALDQRQPAVCASSRSPARRPPSTRSSSPRRRTVQRCLGPV